MSDKAQGNIHEAINKIMQDVGYVKKVKAPNLNYTFAGEAALIAALRPAMVENGVYMHVAAVHRVTRENYTTKSGTPMVNTLIEATVRFTHAPSASTIEVYAVGEGSDAGDKSANKAMTGLYKYALRQTFCIETGNDPDKYASEEREVEAPYREKLIKRLGQLREDARKKGIDVSAYEINERMTDDEIKEVGIELAAKMEAK